MNNVLEINRNIVEIIEKEKTRIPNMERLLGYSANMPSNSANSGSRRLLMVSQASQRLEVYNSQRPLLSTGSENQIGHYSSEFVKTEDELKVIARVEKYRFVPGHNYFLLVQNTRTGEFDFIQRIGHSHNTESYGFLYNNTYIDKVKPGYTIPKGVPIKKSTSYDDNNNREDGVNLDVTYITNEETKEDSIEISDYGAELLSAPLIENFSTFLSENEIPVNTYGNDTVYKAIPDIGEKIANGIVMVTRVEKKNEIMFAQSTENLKKIFIGDTRFSLKGEVVDINIYCNNPEFLNTNPNYAQFKYYYDQQMDFAKEMVDAIETYTDVKRHSYQLEKLHYRLKQQLEEVPFSKDKSFSNILIEITAVEMNPLRVGDKITNRYGGKGVISEIRPRHMMPYTIVNGEKIYADIIYNSNTCVNRVNPGQLFEMSINFICQNITSRIYAGDNINSLMEMYYNFIRIVAPDMYKFVREKFKVDELGSMVQILESIKRDGGINVSQKPITEVMTVDKLKELYDVLPWIEQYKVIVPQVNSNGDIRYIYARRRMVISKQYMYRLKQYAEEKFSVTSLSTTNIRNENSKNSLKKNHKSPYSKTPTRFTSEMEVHDMIHLGAENVITILMIHSASPAARRLCEQLLTGDPFKVDIRLDENCRNRSVEIVNTYLRTIGLKLNFKKIPRVKTQFMTRSIDFMERCKEDEKLTFMHRDSFDTKRKFCHRGRSKLKRD